MKKTIIFGLILGFILFLAFVAISEVATFLARAPSLKLWSVSDRSPAALWDIGGRSRFQLLINEEKFNQFIENHFSSYELPVKDASLEILKVDDDYIIRLIPSKEGLVVNKTLLKLELKENLKQLKNPPQKIYLIKSYPKIRAGDVAQARMKAYQILNTSINLGYEDPSTHSVDSGQASSGQVQKWKVPREEIVEWIGFSNRQIHTDEGRMDTDTRIRESVKISQKSVLISNTLTTTLNHQKIKNFITPLAPEINKEPINAELEIKNGKVVAFALSHEGKKLEIEESARRIAEEMLEVEPPISRDMGGSTSHIKLVVSTLKPQITTESIDNLGITTLIGKGESNFAGSPRNRIHNIKVSTQKLSGTLIKPGEEFSFNKTLGKVGPATGYLPELVIKKDKITPEFGGGVCQVSTTMFRAALFSGLPIIERFPHAFPVVYYHPQGMDATVYSPHPDLKFKNDTPGHVLIQKKIIGTKLIFEMFGTDDGREVKIKGPYVIAKAKDGSMKTVLYREIYRNGELVKEETFRSNYASPAKYPRSE